MKRSTFFISLMIGMFAALFSFLGLFLKDDEENESAFFH